MNQDGLNNIALETAKRTNREVRSAGGMLYIVNPSQTAGIRPIENGYEVIGHDPRWAAQVMFDMPWPFKDQS